jgi:nucleoside-diphosphate-sugar epimerase
MILVTGGTGFAGSYLLYYLLQEGREIRAIRRAKSDLTQLAFVFRLLGGESAEVLLQKIEWTEGDLLDEYFLKEAVEGVEMIYHAAAVVSYHRKEHSQMLRCNIEGTAGLVNAALEAGVGKMAYMSSVAVLAKKQEGLTTEEDKVEGRHFNNKYAESKYRAEMEIWRGHTEGLKATVINPSVILGGGFFSRGSTAIIRTVADGFPFYPPGSGGYVDVRDVAQALIALSRREDAYGQRFIASAANLSYKELFDMIANAYGIKPPAIRTGKILNTLAWIAAGFKAGLAGGKPFITREIADSSERNVAYNSEKLKDFLGFEFIPVEQTVKYAVEAYKIWRREKRKG